MDHDCSGKSQSRAHLADRLHVDVMKSLTVALAHYLDTSTTVAFIEVFGKILIIFCF